jgi:nitrogenase molybdenum-iron protein alpha/beta subunit
LYFLKNSQATGNVVQVYILLCSIILGATVYQMGVEAVAPLVAGASGCAPRPVIADGQVHRLRDVYY